MNFLEEIMQVDHIIFLRKGEDTIACFKKQIEMPCLPPIGSLMFFGDKRKGFPQKVQDIFYIEENSIYQAKYEIDILKEETRLQDFISDSFFPEKLVKDFGFNVDWIDDEYENIREFTKKS